MNIALRKIQYDMNSLAISMLAHLQINSAYTTADTCIFHNGQKDYCLTWFVTNTQGQSRICLVSLLYFFKRNCHCFLRAGSWFSQDVILYLGATIWSTSHFPKIHL